MLLHLDKDAGTCTECKALCTCACGLFISAQPQSLFLFHTHGCSALPVLLLWSCSSPRPPHAGKVLDIVICVVELGQELQWGSCISRVLAEMCWAAILSCLSGVQSPHALRGGDVFTAGVFGLLTDRKHSLCEPFSVATV